MNSDAENRGRSAMVAPVASAGKHDGVERVAVEERHGAVEHVVGGRATYVPLAMPAARPWRHAHGLRRAGGAGREDVARTCRRRSAGRSRPSGWPTSATACAPRRVVRRRCTVAPPRSSPSSRPAVRRVGEHELAVGVADVAGQLLASTGAVDADHRRTGRAPHRTGRTGSRACSRAAGRRGTAAVDRVLRGRASGPGARSRADDLAPGPAAVVERRCRRCRRRPAMRSSSATVAGPARRSVTASWRSLIAFLAMMFFWISVAPAPIDV